MRIAVIGELCFAPYCIDGFRIYGKLFCGFAYFSVMVDWNQKNDYFCNTLGMSATLHIQRYIFFVATMQYLQNL